LVPGGPLGVRNQKSLRKTDRARTRKNEKLQLFVLARPTG
jgi:hypothetical protein